MVIGCPLHWCSRRRKSRDRGRWRAYSRDDSWDSRGWQRCHLRWLHSHCVFRHYYRCSRSHSRSHSARSCSTVVSACSSGESGSLEILCYTLLLVSYRLLCGLLRHCACTRVPSRRTYARTWTFFSADCVPPAPLSAELPLPWLPPAVVSGTRERRKGCSSPPKQGTFRKTTPPASSRHL